MTELALPALVGRNPLGFLAAIGVLDVLDRSGAAVTLQWRDPLVPTAVLRGIDDLDDLVERCDSDRRRWLSSPLLTWAPDGGQPLDDLKPSPAELRRWAEELASGLPQGRANADLFCALVAEGAVAGKGDAKPTHLHFTAGQQRFLDMVRHLAAAVSHAEFEEALRGPWTYTSTLPSLGWDAGGERIYALRAVNPASERRAGVPGADWLAFLGLSSLPVFTAGTSLRTTGCSRDWKRGWFRWVLWDVPLRSRTIRSLLADPTVAAAPGSERAARGILTVLQAPIRRTDQGGYGSFGPATLAPKSPPRAAPRSRRSTR